MRRSTGRGSTVRNVLITGGAGYVGTLRGASGGVVPGRGGPRHRGHLRSDFEHSPGKAFRARRLSASEGAKQHRIWALSGWGKSSRTGKAVSERARACPWKRYDRALVLGSYLFPPGNGRPDCRQRRGKLATGASRAPRGVSDPLAVLLPRVGCCTLSLCAV